MENNSPPKLRRGWTTGACATAATKAALVGLWGGDIPQTVAITLPNGEKPEFGVGHGEHGPGWVEVGIIKDAGDDPDVTHGAVVIARVETADTGVIFCAGSGVGTITKPGLPIGVGEPAINPVPRQMMQAVVAEMAVKYNQKPDVMITLSIPGGQAIAKKTWNPRLGIVGGLSILGTTGIVRPFSCSAWIASIHRGVDVARATGLKHVAGCTGSTSEKAVQKFHDLGDGAMLDMGDFAGGLIKYLVRNPVDRLTIGGGIGKMTKLAQGAVDLHSRRSQVDISGLAKLAGLPEISTATTALHALEMGGKSVAIAVANEACGRVGEKLDGSGIAVDVIIVDRKGEILARAR